MEILINWSFLLKFKKDLRNKRIKKIMEKENQQPLEKGKPEEVRRSPESQAGNFWKWEDLELGELTLRRVAELKAQIEAEGRREQEGLNKEQKEYNSHRLVVFEPGRSSGELVTRTLGKVGLVKENPQELKVEPGKVYDVTIVEEVSGKGKGGFFQLRVEEEIDPDQIDDRTLFRYNNLEVKEAAENPKGTNLRQLSFEQRKGRWGAVYRDYKGSDLDGVERTGPRLVTLNEENFSVGEVKEGEEYLVVLGETGREIPTRRGGKMVLQKGMVLKPAREWLMQPRFNRLGGIELYLLRGVKKESLVQVGSREDIEKKLPVEIPSEYRAKLEAMLKIKEWEKGQNQERDKIAVEFIRGFQEAWEQAEARYCEEEVELKEVSEDFCRFEWDNQDYTFEPYLPPSELGRAPGFFVKKGDKPGIKSSEDPVSEHPYFKAWEEQRGQDPDYLLKTEIVRALMKYSQEDPLEIDWGDSGIFDSSAMRNLVGDIRSQGAEMDLDLDNQGAAVARVSNEEAKEVYLGSSGLGQGRLKGSLVFRSALVEQGGRYFIRYVVDPEKTELKVNSKTLHLKLKARIKTEILDPLIEELSQATKEGEQLIKMGGQEEEGEVARGGSGETLETDQGTPGAFDPGEMEGGGDQESFSKGSAPNSYRELNLGELSDDEYGRAGACANEVLNYAKYDRNLSFSVGEANSTRDELTQLVAFERRYNPEGPIAEAIQGTERLTGQDCAVVWRIYKREEISATSENSESAQGSPEVAEEVLGEPVPAQGDTQQASPTAGSLADLKAMFGGEGSKKKNKKSSKKKK